MINSQELKSEIVRCFGTQQQFAQEIGWSPNKLSNLMQHKYIPDVDEVGVLTEKLSLTSEQFFLIFLPTISPNGDKRVS